VSSTDHKAPRYVVFSAPPVTSFLLGPNIFLSSLCCKVHKTIFLVLAIRWVCITGCVTSNEFSESIDFDLLQKSDK